MQYMKKKLRTAEGSWGLAEGSWGQLRAFEGSWGQLRAAHGWIQTPNHRRKKNYIYGGRASVIYTSLKAFFYVWNCPFFYTPNFNPKIYNIWESLIDSKPKWCNYLSHWRVEFEFDLRLFTAQFSNKAILDTYMKVKRMWIKNILRRIHLISNNEIKPSESFCKQSSQSLWQIIAQKHPCLMHITYLIWWVCKFLKQSNPLSASFV